MSETSIEWTDRSINPIRARLGQVVGHHCEKVSPGCAHCYASRLQARFRMPEYRADLRQGVEHFFDESRLQEVLTRRKPTKWFWCDMSDLFGSWVPDEWIDRCFAVMALTPWHTHQVLTKRPERMRAYLGERPGRCQCGGEQPPTCVGVYEHPEDPPSFGCDDCCGHGNEDGYCRRIEWPLPNVWLGVSCEDQETADERIPLLLQTQAAVRYVSAEPLLGGLDLRAYMATPVPYDPYGEGQLNWVIVGGESGPHARPCDLAWIRSLVQQCKAADTACFVKQLGAAPFYGGVDCGYPNERFGAKGIYLKDRKGGDMTEWPEDLRGMREFPRVAEAVSA